MRTKIKRIMGLMTGIVLAAQLTGCYADVEHHYHPWWHRHHEEHHHDEAEIVVHP